MHRARVRSGPTTRLACFLSAEQGQGWDLGSLAGSATMAGAGTWRGIVVHRGCVIRQPAACSGDQGWGRLCSCSACCRASVACCATILGKAMHVIGSRAWMSQTDMDPRRDAWNSSGSAARGGRHGRATLEIINRGILCDVKSVRLMMLPNGIVAQIMEDAKEEQLRCRSSASGSGGSSWQPPWHALPDATADERRQRRH